MIIPKNILAAVDRMFKKSPEEFTAVNTLFMDMVSAVKGEGDINGSERNVIGE